MVLQIFTIHLHQVKDWYLDTNLTEEIRSNQSGKA